MHRHMPGKPGLPLTPDTPALRHRQRQRRALGRKIPPRRRCRGPKRAEPRQAALSPRDAQPGRLQLSLTQRLLPTGAGTRTEQCPKPSPCLTPCSVLLCSDPAGEQPAWPPHEGSLGKDNTVTAAEQRKVWSQYGEEATLLKDSPGRFERQNPTEKSVPSTLTHRGDGDRSRSEQSRIALRSRLQAQSSTSRSAHHFLALQCHVTVTAGRALPPAPSAAASPWSHPPGTGQEGCRL